MDKLSAANSLLATAIKSDLAAFFSLLFISTVGWVAWHNPLAIGILQPLLLLLLLALPLYGFLFEPKPERIKEHWSVLLGFSTLTAILVYINFWLCFARQGLAIGHISTSNPFYFEASATAILTLLLCQFLNLLFLRAHHHERFFAEHLHKNRKILELFVISLIIFLIVSYIRPLRELFSAGSLSPVDYAWAIIAAGIYVCLRILQRHTRKHSRHTVIQLHKQVVRSR